MKALLFANTDWYLYNFRRDLALGLLAHGDDVVLLSPPGEYAARLKQMNFRWLEFPLERRGMNPMAELGTLARLVRLYRRERPDLVHHFTIKCVLYGTLAARLAGVRAVVNSITGLGYVFLPGGLWKRILRFFVCLWYRLILHGTQVIFENDDDRQTFLRYGFIHPEDGHLIPGVGVDTIRFRPSPLPEGIPVVLLAARLLWDKGVGEFVEAARHLCSDGVQARFALAGRTDPGNPASISDVQIKTWRDEGVIEWWGWFEDMSLALAKITIFCLPSYYREGLPTVLMEASACGRPVITTDWSGCRDAIRNGVSGLLVRERDVTALSDALRKLIGSPALCREMGSAGRNLVEEMFSSEKIISRISAVYAEALAKGMHDDR
ncbi:MAG TPA: glycosyltransferase family 4 protein [Anaerolineales bacterium]